MIYLDTHVVCWLYLGDPGYISPLLRKRLNEAELWVSPMVAFELRYLYEIGRIRKPEDQVLFELQSLIELQICTMPFESVISEAIRQTWTRDPFDRIIVGHAAVRQAPLITKDRSILKHYPGAIWE